MANVNTAPYPDELQDLVKKTKLEPGWQISLADIDRGQGSSGLTLVIRVLSFDTYHPENGRKYAVLHYFPVPPAAFNRRSWQRWLLDRYLDVVQHEACEFFQIDGVRPYAPHHGPGNDPYIIFEVGTEEEQLKRYDDMS